MVNLTQVILLDMDYYRINERAWELIIKELRKRRKRGETLDAIGKLLTAHKSTVKLWLDNQRGGERTSFRDMVRYLDRLQIPFEEIFGAGIDFPEEPRASIPTRYEAHVATTLSATAAVFGKKAETISSTAFNNEIPPATVQAMLDGKQTMTIGEFTSICNAIGIAPANVLERATELSKEDSRKDRTDRRTA